VLSHLYVDAQTFGGLPPSVRWLEINTDTVRVIFPEQLETQAQRLTNAIHYLRSHAQDDIGDRTQKIDIIINNQSTIANGSVSIAPWKSHFLTTPLQDNFALTSMPWLDLLAIHEYRHVTQLSTARRGIVKLISYLFGQESWAGGANLSIPNWFTEGDAVWAETQFSNQGRGRVAQFLQGYRALSLGHGFYSYSKARNGSLKDYVPDHYRLGYLLLEYGHEKYDPLFWKEILAEAAAYRGLVYPFSNAIKRKTSLNVKAFYQAMLEEKSKTWPDHQEKPSALPILPKVLPKTFTDYHFPQLMVDSTLQYFKRTYDKIGRFYQYDLRTDQEINLITRGLSLETYFGTNGNQITWTELTTDPRWIEKDYTDIIIFDLEKHERKRITHRQRFFSPQPDKEGSKIVCVEVDKESKSSIHIVDEKSGETLQKYQRQGWFYTFPKWSSDEKSVIAAVRNERGQMALIEIDIAVGVQRELIAFKNRIIGAPAIDDEEVFYSASTSDVEQIFATSLRNGITRQVTDEINGAFQPSVGRYDICYTTFTDLGRIIKKVAKNSQISSSSDYENYEFEVTQNVLDSFAEIKYPVTKYNQWAHSLNLHTWGLNFEDPEIVARALSNNVLNNVEVSAGVSYNYDQQIYRPFAEVQIATAYPVLALQGSTIKRSAIINDVERSWRETNLFAGAYVDYNLSSRSFRRKLTPLFGLNRSGLTGDIDTSISSLLGQITFVQQQIQARKNIFTHNGQYLQMRYSRSIDSFKAGQLVLRSGLAFRGLGINHNILFEADLKADLQGSEYQFTNGLNHRGYGVLPAEKAMRLAADYHFPLFYPDWGLAGLIYFYRVRADLFYEYSHIFRGFGTQPNFQSVGAEVVFDVNLVNEVAASFGLRYSLPINNSTGPSFEIFIPVYRF
jgi:hypothetical protein